MFISSKIKPPVPCYILSDDNHIGWYFGGNVYFFSYIKGKGNKPEPDMMKLSKWCEKYTELANVCDMEKYIQAGGHSKEVVWTILDDE